MPFALRNNAKHPKQTIFVVVVSCRVVQRDSLIAKSMIAKREKEEIAEVKEAIGNCRNLLQVKDL
jgi:hypothetical protein